VLILSPFVKWQLGQLVESLKRLKIGLIKLSNCKMAPRSVDQNFKKYFLKDFDLVTKVSNGNWSVDQIVPVDNFHFKKLLIF
jgi:hypothetical protein